MTVIQYMTSIIYQALNAAFVTAQSAFRSIGLDWITAVSGMAVTSIVLRSFFQVFVGNSMTVAMTRSRHELTRVRKIDQRKNADSAGSGPKRLAAGGQHQIGNGEYHNRHKSGRSYTWK